MLVVADEQTAGVCRQRGLARTRQAKQHRGVAGVRVDVGRAVHGQHAVLDRQQVVHEREDGLLDLAGVARARDNHPAAREVEHDGRLGVGAVGGRVAAVPWRGEHRDVGVAKVGELLGRGAHEHLVDEQRLARTLADDADLARVGAVGAGQAVHHIEAASVEVARHARADTLVGVAAHGNVDLAPADHVMHAIVVDDVAVVRRTARARARVDYERPVGREAPLARRERRLDEAGGRQVCEHLLGRRVGTVAADEPVHLSWLHVSPFARRDCAENN